MKFLDGKERTFIPYKGFCIKKDNGELEPDPLMVIQSPLKVIDDIEKFSNPNVISDKHITYNILDNNGNMALSKWVRKITYYPYFGYYIIEDNNEDNLRRINGAILTNDYREGYNIVTKEGVLLSKEWFEKVSPSTNGYVHICRNHKQNLIDMHGQFFLNEDADYVTNYNGNFAYCLRGDIMYKAYEGGQEELCKRLIKCDIADYDISAKSVIPLIWINTKAEPCVQNISFLKQYFLFQQWYKSITPSGIGGLFYVTKEETTQLIDIAENVINDSDFNPISCFENNVACFENNKQYGLMNACGEIIAQGYTAVLWADHTTWGMNLCVNGEKKHYWHGQGNDCINYVHEFLLNNKIIALFEKDNVWYYPDMNNQMVSIFEYSPLQLV